MSINFDNQLQFLDYWVSHLNSKVPKKGYDSYKIGIELEFFLMNQSGSPVSLHQSQLFLSILKDLLLDDVSETRVEYEEINGLDCISALKPQFKKNAWVSIAYEYSPHLLEISFSPHHNLNELESEMIVIFQLLENASAKSGTILNFEKCLSDNNILKINEEINSKQANLKKSREDLLEASPFRDDKNLANFPAFIAATHVHLSGHHWLEDKDFVNRLYRLEPYVMLETGSTELKNKWEFYHKLFINFTLVGFPNFPEWKFENWASCLYKESYLKLDKSAPLEIHKLRDLQAIRPRVFGTIEFRSDCASNTSQEILRLAAIRLGQFILATRTDSVIDIPSYQDSRLIWNSHLITGKYKDLKTHNLIMSKIKNILIERGLGEEIHLSPLNIDEE